MDYLKGSVVVGYSTDSSLLDDWDAQVALSHQHRKKKQKVDDPLAKLRLLKSDIRKTYATMFANVVNSNDLSLLYGFLDTFPTSTVYQACGCQTSKFSPVQYFSQAKGATNMFRFWCSTLNLVPDSVIRIQHTSINFPESVGCNTTISAYFTLELTRIYDAEFPVKSNFLTDDEEVDNEVDKTGIMKKVITQVSNRLSQVPLLKVPVKVSTMGKFVLSIDDDKRIRGLEWVVIRNSTAADVCGNIVEHC